MKTLRAIALFLILTALAACGAKTKVVVMDEAAIGDDNIHIVVASDDVDDPLSVGDYLVEEFEKAGITAETRTGSKATAQLGSGSGFVVAPNYWLTNNHVIKDLDDITISVVGRDIPAELITTDPILDLALLKADTSGLKSIRIGKAKIGDEIYAIGYPVPDILSSHARVTSGIVSSLFGCDGDANTIQISAPIQPGNSGGPVVDNKWELAGVVVSTASTVTMTKRVGTIPQGLNFAVSPNLAKGFLLQNNIQPEQPYAASLQDVIASTGLIWNGDVSKKKHTYIAQFGYRYYWDMANHISTLSIAIVDATTREVIIKSKTTSSSAGVATPAEQAVREILAKLNITATDRK